MKAVQEPIAEEEEMPLLSKEEVSGASLEEEALCEGGPERQPGSWTVMGISRSKKKTTTKNRDLIEFH